MTIETELTVRKAVVFGNPFVYPVCARAKLFADLAGTVTLRNCDIKIIKSWGFVYKVKKDEGGV